jgi:hypothetical protein
MSKYLPGKATQLVQEFQNSLPAQIPIFNTFRFRRFNAGSAFKKPVSKVVRVVVSYVLLTHSTICSAGPFEIIPPPRSYILHNSCGVFSEFCNGLLVNGDQIYIRRMSEFIQQNRNGVPKFAQPVNPIFFESQKMRQQSEGVTNTKTHAASQNVWKPCIHIMIAEICGLLGFCVALLICGKFRNK